jgi:ABC-type nitrate/sulfonate/bicarbonate transport system substrate-binding protein
VIPGDLVSRLPKFCARLCLLSKVYIAGISTKPVTSPFELKNRRFAVLAGSSFVTRLTFESRNWGFEFVPPLVLPSLQDCARALIDGTAHCIAGWEPFVTHARRAVERSRPVHNFPHGELGWFEMHAAVNLRTAHPAAVRAYLSGLQESVSYTNGRKSVAAFHAEIGKRYGLEPSEVRNILANVIFSATELDAATGLCLWEREALLHSHGRISLQQDSIAAR